MVSFFFVGRFATPGEFSVNQLYDIYMQNHALDDLAFSIEFKVGFQTRFRVLLYSSIVEYS
jgi:hypothetical protein